MDIKKLSDSELIGRFGKLVQTERKITHLVLECIAEIDLRKIYLEQAYPSLFEFLVKRFGYSPSAAVRRIESARLLRDIPEISKNIEEGSLNLSQLSKMQQAIRTVQKTESRQLDISEKRKLLKKIENTTQDQTELILSQELNLPLIVESREKIHRDESVTLTLTFSKEQMALLVQAQDLMSHIVPGGEWTDVMMYLAQKEIMRRTQIKRQRKIPLKSSEASFEEPANVILKFAGFTRKSIRPNLRKSIFAKAAGCQYKDPRTNKICTSTRFLEVDHIQPVWAGGDDSPSNLKVLCSQHNKFKYRKESGVHPLRW